MKQQITIFCKVGRAAAQALGTADYTDEELGDAVCDALQARKTQELITSGVDLGRVKFTRKVTPVVSEKEDEEATSAPAKKVKGR